MNYELLVLILASVSVTALLFRIHRDLQSINQKMETEETLALSKETRAFVANVMNTPSLSPEEEEGVRRYAYELAVDATTAEGEVRPK